MTKEIQLSKYTVTILGEITWGMKEEIKGVALKSVNIVGTNPTLSGNVTQDMTTKAFELIIKKIVDESGKEIPYTKDWAYNLSIADGDKLFAEIDSITNPKV